MAQNPVVHAQIIAELGEFGTFEECSGGEFDGVHTDYYEAGRLSPRKVSGTHSITDLVLTRAYDPQRDGSLIDWVRLTLAGIRPDRTRTLVKTVLSSQGIPIDTIVYPNCKARHIKLPDAKAGDSSLAQIIVTLSVEAVI